MQILHILKESYLLLFKLLIIFFMNNKLANALIEDLKGDWEKPSIKFFRSSGAYGYVVWLTIINCNYSKKEMTVESIVREVLKYASRRTILDFLDKGVKGGFLIKQTSTKDKRKSFIFTRNNTIYEYEVWSKKFINSIIK